MLLGQPDAEQEVCETRVGAQVVPSRIPLEPLHLKRALLVPLFEPGKSLILLAQTRVDKGNVDRGYVLLPRLRLAITGYTGLPCGVTTLHRIENYDP